MPRFQRAFDDTHLTALAAAGHPLALLARELGCHHTQVTRALARLGLAVPTGPWQPGPTQTAISEKFRASTWTTSALASRLRCDPQQLYRELSGRRAMLPARLTALAQLL